VDIDVYVAGGIITTDDGFWISAEEAAGVLFPQLSFRKPQSFNRLVQQ
jgi:hypothetical protein